MSAVLAVLDAPPAAASRSEEILHEVFGYTAFRGAQR